MFYFALLCLFFFKCYVDHRDLHVLTHSFPTRRSSDLSSAGRSRTSAASPERFSSNFPRPRLPDPLQGRSEEHTSELQSLMRISYAVFCLKKKTSYVTIDQESTISTSSIKLDINHLLKPVNR